MEIWEEAVKVALLGTAHQKLAAEILPLPVQELVNQLTATEPEEIFFKTSALLMNYEQAGRTMPVLQINLPKPAEPDEKSNCSDKALQTLNAILEEGFPTLLPEWLQKCAQQQLVVREDYVPVILDEGKKNIKLRPLIKAVTGNRGKWLATFNDTWNYLNQTEQEIWEQGKPEERKQFLLRLRQENPAEARALLVAAWKEENANSRTELLSTFFENLSPTDEPWLKELLADNSQKVKETVTNLLGQLPDSEWVKEVWQEVKSWIHVKKSTSFIAFIKEELEITIPENLPAALKQKGVQELSNQKNQADQEYWLIQALALIPPSFWEKHIGAEPEKIFSLFEKHEILRKTIPGLIAAAVRFKDATWAKLLLEKKLKENEWVKIPDPAHLYQLLALLPETEQKEYFYKKLDKKSSGFNLKTIDFLLGLQFEWDLAFSIKALQELASEYSETTLWQFYGLFDLHLYLHPDVLLHLPNIVPPNSALLPRWQSLQNKLVRALELKQAIREGFSD
ncbi:MAG: DUF5691 domain-containing protein [Adhaeribacter sp.]